MTDTATQNSLDSIFAPGPVGFLAEDNGPSRLRRFVCAMNPGVPLEPSPQASRSTDDSDDADDPDAIEDVEELEADEVFQGADAWRADAVRRWSGLWSGEVSSIRPVFGVEAPEQLVAFERATAGADPWSTFEELRLNAAIMGLPDEDENLFEKCVLNDQLNYLGTALPEVFAGLACIGTLGNGDSYHLELAPPEGRTTHTVYFYDHETAAFEHAFSVDIETLAFLTALCRAVDDDLVSKQVAEAGFRALHTKVTPSWHFGMDERDKTFEPWEQPPNEALPLLMFWRARWLFDLFRQDGVAGVADLRDCFAEKLNVVLPPERLPERLKHASRFAPTALYATWRAYLFDEPELPQYLDMCREHPARLVRDAARLIDELRNGRESLGRIDDWPRLLERFRALDLDPRRATEREAEATRRQESLEEERVAVREALATLEADAELAFVTERLARPELHGVMLHRMLERPDRAKTRRGVRFLLDQEYARDNSIFRHEEHDACRFVAANMDAAVSLLILGMAMFQGSSDESEPCLKSGDALRIVMDAPDKTSETGRKALRNELAALSLEDHPSWREKLLVQLAGRLADEGSAPALRSLLAQVPSEGGFETSLHYDDFVGAIAVALRHIGDVAAADVLAPFASSATLRMRNARIESALTIAAVAPGDFTDQMAERALEMTAKVNDDTENAKALLAIAKAKPEFAAVKAAKPMAASHSTVRTAKALAEGNRERARSELDVVYTEPRYNAKYTIEQRRLGLLVHELFGLLPDRRVLEQATGLDPDLDAELARLGGFQAPRRITWFDVEEMDSTALREVLEDRAVLGRSHAARRVRGDEASRAALESAIESVLETTFGDDGRYLLAAAVESLTALPEAESTVALCDRLLRHESTDIKDPVLRRSPAWSGLKGGMEHVRDQKWGWQEQSATTWLHQHG